MIYMIYIYRVHDIIYIIYIYIRIYIYNINILRECLKILGPEKSETLLFNRSRESPPILRHSHVGKCAVMQVKTHGTNDAQMMH